MTINVDERKAAMLRALCRLADLCGDASGIDFGDKDLAPAEPLRTTLDELKGAGLIAQVVSLSNPEPFALTLEGWFTAQRVSGRFDSAEFHARRGRVCAAMKQATAGRNESAILDWRELAEAADVPDGWLWNVLDAQVLYRLDNKGRYWVRFEDGCVWVESTFGQEPVGF